MRTLEMNRIHQSYELYGCCKQSRESSGCCFSTGLPNSELRKTYTLSTKQRTSLETNWHSLVQLMTPVGEKIGELHAVGCITSRQRDILEKQPSPLRVKRLIEIMSHKSLTDVGFFIRCMPEAVQHGILNLINDSDTTGKV
jgi:hypothetical protein